MKIRIFIWALIGIFSIGCDRHILKLYQVELPAAVSQSSLIDKIEQIAAEHGYYLVQPPASLVARQNLLGRNVLAQFNAKPAGAGVSGPQIYFILFSEKESRAFNLEFHQFPNLSEVPQFAKLQQQIAEVLHASNIRLSLKNGN